VEGSGGYIPYVRFPGWPATATAARFDFAGLRCGEIGFGPDGQRRIVGTRRGEVLALCRMAGRVVRVRRRDGAGFGAVGCRGDVAGTDSGCPLHCKAALEGAVRGLRGVGGQWR